MHANIKVTDLISFIVVELSMEHSQVFTRKLSLSDLIYAASGYKESDQNQLVCQLIVEGRGSIDEQVLQKAVEKAAHSNPAIRAQLRGFWGIKYWSSTGPLPRIKTIHQEWDGHYRQDSTFIDKPLDLIHGPVAEIIQVIGEKTYLVFRIHHAVTDGVGLMDYVRCVFQALNHQQSESFYSKVTVERLPPGNLKAIPPKVTNALIPFPLDNMNHQEFDRSRLWTRLIIPGKDNKILLKTILAIAELARGCSEESIRIHVPASLRRHVPREKTSANLIGMVRLDVEKSDTCRTLVKKFNARLEEKQELPIAANSLTSKLTFWVPLRLLRKLEKMAMGKMLERPRFQCSGTASSLGKIEFQEFSTDTFKANGCYGIPVPPLGSPLMAVLVSHDNATEIVLSANRTLISECSMGKISEQFKQIIEISR